MRSEFDVAHTLFCSCINNPDLSITEAHVEPLFSGIKSQVIRIGLTIDGVNRKIGIGIEESDTSIFAIRDCNLTRPFEKSYSLRFAKTPYAVHDFVRRQIDHLNRV